MYVGLPDSDVIVRRLEEEEVPYFVSKVFALSEWHYCLYQLQNSSRSGQNPVKALPGKLSHIHFHC